MQPPKMVRDYLSGLGKKGGKVKSQRKKATSAANLAAGRLKRWPKRRLKAKAA